MGSVFSPGGATEVIKKIEDRDLAEIAQAEAHYFSAEAEECVSIVRKYLDSEDIMLRMSADMLYTFANLTLGNAVAAQNAREDVYRCLRQVLQEQENMEIQASCLFALYVISVLIHIPPEEDLPLLKDYLRYLPMGQRLFAIHLMAHGTYLNQEYAKAEGMIQTALAMSDQVYPIPFIYLYCVKAMCQISQKDQEGARDSIIQAWEMARPDKFLQPFIEHHGLMPGVLEVWVKQRDPDVYKKLMDGVIAFSRGWMKIHNPKMQKAVTNLLTPVEFSIAMLACRDWTNQEIADHMGLSVNTVKHYVSTILEKLHIDKRDKIKEFVLQ